MATDSKEKIILELSEVIKSNPNDANAFFNRGLIYAEMGNNNAAIKDYREAIRLNPDLQDPLKPHFEKAAVAIPYDKVINDIMFRGLEFYNKKEYESAITNYSAAIQLYSLSPEPQSAVAFASRAACYFVLKKYDLALKDLDEAIRLGPYYSIAFNNRGQIYSKQGKYDLAVQALNASIRLDPNNIAAFVNRGCVYFNQGKYKLAIKDFREAVRMNPDYEPVLNKWREEAAAKVANKETNAPEKPLNPTSMIDEIAKVKENLKSPSPTKKTEPTDEKSRLKFSIEKIIETLTDAHTFSENTDPNLQVLNRQVLSIINELNDFNNNGMKDKASLEKVLGQMGDISKLSQRKSLFTPALQAEIKEASTALTKIKEELFASADKKNVAGK